MASFSGEKLKTARGKRDQTQLALALRRRGFGTTQTQISRWENGKSPRRYIIAALAEELGVAVAELFDADEDEEEDMNAPLTRAVLRQVISDEIRSALKERTR